MDISRHGLVRHGRILRRRPQARKATTALWSALLATGCLDDPRADSPIPISERDVLIIESSGEACEAASGTSCAPLDLQTPCATALTWRLELSVTSSGCDVPGVDADELALPIAGEAIEERPILTLTAATGADLALDPDSVNRDAKADEGATPTGDSTLVFRSALGAFNPTRCGWPFEAGWFRDTAAGTRQIVRLHGVLGSDGSATGTGERRDESVYFACASDLRIVRAVLTSP